jgi:hypothetical protein
MIVERRQKHARFGLAADGQEDGDGARQRPAGQGDALQGDAFGKSLSGRLAYARAAFKRCAADQGFFVCGGV